MPEYEVERVARDARLWELCEGTREMQKIAIASYLIGKVK